MEEGASGTIAKAVPFSQLSTLTENINALRSMVEQLQISAKESQQEIAQLRSEMSKKEDDDKGCSHEFQQNFAVTHTMTPDAVRIDRDVKLYDLPQFSGKIEEWPLFYANFVESTQRFNYPDYMNLMRLQKALSGVAKEAVASLLIFPSDVPKVIEELKFRFGRSDILVRDQLKKLHELPNVSLAKPEQIVEFSTKMRNVVSLLSAADCRHHLSNAILLDEVVAKLPLNQQLEWAKHAAILKPCATMNNFSDWLNQLARVVCEIPPPVQRKDKQKPRHLMHLSQQDDKKSGNCYSCQENHQFQKCPKYLKLPVDDRWKEVQKLNLCFSCLSKGHSLSKCPKKQPCGEVNCRKSHHKTLHTVSTKDGHQANTSQSSVQSTVEAHVLTNSHSQRKSLFKILPVTLYGPCGNLDTFAMIDEGSAISLLEENVSKDLGLRGRSQPLTLMWYGQRSTTEPSTLVQLEISGIGTRKFGLKRIQTVQNLDLPQQSFKKRQFPGFKDIELPEYVDAKPTLLLGLDNVWLGTPSKIVEGFGSEPTAAKTRLGWIVYGPSSPLRSSDNQIVLHIHQEKRDELHQILDDYLRNDNFGTNCLQTKLESEEDKVAREILSSTVKHIGTRYEIGLLWKRYPPNFPESYSMAKKRLINLEKRMEREPEFASHYRMEMRKYFEKGYARYATPEEIQHQNTNWYLPHFAVTNINKPGRLRIVFDAAAKVNDTSLNSTLLKGPEQMQSLMEILFRFRQNQVGVAADICEMFSQVKIRQTDQQVQRFLWRDDPQNPVISHCLMSSMIFGAICSPCCAEFIKNHNAESFRKELPEAADAVIRKHYVDDFVCGFNSEEDAVKLCQEVVMIHANAGFLLRNFVSNSKLVEKTMNQSKLPPFELMNLERQAATEKILGMYWNTKLDKFEFHTKFQRVPKAVMNADRPPTKRELLSVVMSIFDPFGFVADFSIFSKVLIQEVWKRQVDWDEPIPPDLQHRWLSWWTEIRNMKDRRIPRWYSPLLQKDSKIELHIFVDASQSAFAAVGYFRVTNGTDVDVCFVSGKTKVAPTKPLTIPRLELQAAILGVRLSQTIQQCHDIVLSRIMYWCDSRTVLQWINSAERKYKSFVAHRITEILSMSIPSQWKWIPSKMNTADVATRPSFPPKFEADSEWISGPDFLRFEEANWPSEKLNLSLEPLEEEIVTCLLSQKQESIFESVFNKFSSYLKLKRVFAWMLRAINHFDSRNITNLSTVAKYSSFMLTVAEMERAEKVMCKLVQKECFGVEINDLQSANQLSKQSKIFRLSPYLDEDGLLRVQGRIDEAVCLPLETRRPILMPQNHTLSKLIVQHYHCAMHHQNLAATMSRIRQKFWFPCLKTMLKGIQRGCPKCQIDTATPRPPLMGQLPLDRVTPYVRPFSYSGVDLFGPINVAVGRRREKRWAVIFTCLTTRAAHLELAEDLSTDAFLLCLRNFVNRRGTPVRMRCDNGTNFVGAQRELKECEKLLDVERICNESTNQNIEWVFNCPGNPSSGGCWERLIRIIKRLLQHMVKETTPRVETLRSALIEAENILNSRPLTDIPLESAEDEPLTPNHFLIGCSNSTQTPYDEHETSCLRKQWRISQMLKDRFWKRWTVEYLPQLLHRGKWHTKTTPVKEDDLVIICDSNLPRSQWKKGRIIRLFPANDGHVRLVEVKTSTGIFRRPVNRLAVLQIGKSPSDLRGKECYGNPEQPQKPTA